jgi:hypothetical protein
VPPRRTGHSIDLEIRMAVRQLRIGTSLCLCLLAITACTATPASTALQTNTTEHSEGPASADHAPTQTSADAAHPSPPQSAPAQVDESEPASERKRGGGMKPEYLHMTTPTVKVGDEAPGFTLKTPDGKQEVSLESLRGKPVVLIFGSYT